MATYNEQLQRVWHSYEAEHGYLPATMRDAVKWGVAQRMIEAPTPDPYEKLVEDMARALREEYGTDHLGRRYRKNHAVRVTKGGVQHTMWAIMGNAPREHMQKAFIQRREQIVGDCVQLYPVHVMTRKSFGLMTRKLSVTKSQRSAQFRGTVSRRKPSVASANWAHVA